MSLSPREAAEAQARQRFIIMNIARVGGLVLVMFGIMMTRSAPHLSAQWIIGAGLAVLGLLEFFFLPAIVAKRWKAADRKLK
ncbi:MAG: hypothetical protein NWP98_00200 [Erythrobacter sp.]|nr:hypothetical protein [Erythrobacter sp.]